MTVEETDERDVLEELTIGDDADEVEGPGIELDSAVEDKREDEYDT